MNKYEVMVKLSDRERITHTVEAKNFYVTDDMILYFRNDGDKDTAVFPLGNVLSVIKKE